VLEQARRFADARVHPDRLKEFCVQALKASGLSERHAVETAEVLVTTDTWGTHTHGTRQLLPLMHNVRKGGLNASAEPEIVGEGLAWSLIDGNYAMPMVTSRLAMNTAIEKARRAGIAYSGVRHSNHYGAAGFYAMMAVEQGMIGLSVSNVDIRMTIPGARAPVIGTNPLAYAVPAGKERPVFMDIATSVVAISKVLTAKVAGKPIPDNWLVDERGLPTSDPQAYPEKGAIVPMAGHKGYGIALFIEIISGVLTGASFLSGIGNWLADDPEPADQGHAFIALDVESLMPLDRFRQRMDEMIRELREAPRAEGADRIYVPGEMEWERYDEAYSRGIQLPDYVLVNLFTLAEQTGLTPQLESILRG
jgi:ureidoglycolate dehydrogenase (NAD+)